MCPKPDGGNTITANITTAAALAAYRDELLQLGFPNCIATDLVLDAAHQVVSRRELRVNTPAPLDAAVIREDRKVINYLGESYYTAEGWSEVNLAGHDLPSASELINTALEAFGDMMASGFKPNDDGPATVK